jgi:signal transduction histidine kinase
VTSSFAGDGTPAEQVETTLFRALAGVRLVVLAYAVVLNLARFDEFVRPWLAVLDLAVMVGWTAFASWAYDAPRRRRLPLYVADLTVAVLLVLSTPLVQSEEMVERHAATMPSFWVMTAVLAWAVGRHWTEAVIAALVVSVADISVRAHLVGPTWGNIFLLLLAAGVVGYTARMLREAAEVRAVAERAAAVHDERVRLARVVHDGVLQVLTLVQRRGTESAELAELGRVAGEQEAALRRLVQLDAQSSRLGAGLRESADTFDLMAALGALPQRPGVTVTGPGGAVELPAHQVDELVAVVGACLDNVRCHVGEDAPAWVLVEDLGAEVVLTVRDEGPGIPDGRLEEATREGRLGVSQSIRGRIRDLGGSAQLFTAPGLGTEWELTVPRG